MDLSQQQALFASDVAKLILYIFTARFQCTFGEAYRTPEQAVIYAKEGKGIIDSLHCLRLAIDLNLLSPDGKYLTQHSDYEQFGVYWESLNPLNRWGGNFTKHGGKIDDGNHFERRKI